MNHQDDVDYQLTLNSSTIIEEEDYFKSMKDDKYRELFFLFQGITKQLLGRIETLENRVEYLETHLANTLLRLQD